MAGVPQINKVLDAMGITSSFVRGMRYTDDETMDVVEMVLGGKVNKEIVARINSKGGNTVGLTGKDGGLITAEKMTIYQEAEGDNPPEIIDPGMVGTVSRINPPYYSYPYGSGLYPGDCPGGHW